MSYVSTRAINAPAYEEEDTCMSYEEEDTCMSYVSTRAINAPAFFLLNRYTHRERPGSSS
jgi:hypothetical protein